MLSIPDLPGKKMNVEEEVQDEEVNKKNQLYESLYKKKDSMFKRVSPTKTAMKESKSTLSIKSVDPQTMTKTSFGGFSDKNMSLLKKCALQGIRASSFKKLNS